jgi:hypothetical protein
MMSSSKTKRLFAKSVPPPGPIDPMRTRSPSGHELLVSVVPDHDDERTEKKTYAVPAPIVPGTLDSEDDLEGATKAIDVSDVNPFEKTQEPGTVRDVALTLSLAELRALGRTINRAVKKDPELRAYFLRKSKKYDVPEDRASDLSIMLGFND